MEALSVRYGSNIDMTVETDDSEMKSVTFFVSKPGQEPVITIPAEFIDGIAYISSQGDDTRVPLGAYKWQVTFYDNDNRPYKYPNDAECSPEDEVELPDFYVLEALDETEEEA